MKRDTREKSVSRANIRRYSVVIAVLWTLITSYSLYWNYRQHMEGAVLLGKMQASAFFEKDLLFRRWGSLHGGVYVPVTEATPPNPFLSHIPERDITTPGGKKLTLMNPAYMTRQIYEMAEQYKGTGRGHITSLNPIRSQNSADPWEKKALRAFERGVAEVSQTEEIDGKSYYRYMKPMIVEKPCLKCHASQGYHEGDIRGGLSVSVPMDPIYALMKKEMRGVNIVHACIWLLGIAVIGFGARRIEKTTLSLREQAEKLAGEVKKREEAEEVLRKSEERFRRLFEGAADAVFVHDREGRIVDANRLACDSLGYTREELLRMSVTDFETGLHPGDLAPLWERIHAGQSVTVEGKHRRRDGTVFPVEIGIAPFASGDQPLFIAAARDITERRRVERALTEAQERLRHLADQVPGALYQYRLMPDGRTSIPYASDGFYEMYELLPEQVMEDASLTGTRWHPDDAAATASSIRESARTLQMWHHEYRVLLPKQGLRWRLGHARPERLDDGTIQWHGYISDITERKQADEEKRKLEEQLRLSQKMEAIGVLAGGVAHDFNNILTAIIGYANILKMKMKPGDPHLEMADQILASSNRAAQLTQGLLTFSRRQFINPQPTDINTVLMNVRTLLARLIGEDIELSVHAAEDSLITIADAGQIEQVLMNLATNARDAMPDGGMLSMKTQAYQLDREFVSRHGFGKPGAYALITISDTGSGMDEQVREKIFEPFFTTKELGKGTGLGLAIVYGIIKQHNGFINVYSEQGAGTTFKIYLPLVPVAVQEAQAAPAELPRGGSETILYAEDNKEVRELISSVLRDAGYRVVNALDGQDALNKFAEQKGGVDILLLDVIMPKKSGKEVYDAIRATHPRINALFMSGYTDDILQQRGIIDAGIPFVSKPPSPFELLNKIRKILDSKN